MDSLTSGEQRLITSALLLSAGENLGNLKVNYEELAKSAGLKSAASAQVLFCKARRNFLAAIKERKSGGDNANTEDITHKKVSADKVTKRPPKAAAKAKGATKTSKKATVEDAIVTADETPAAGSDEETGPKKKKKVTKSTKKTKTDHNEFEVAIKPEPEVKAEPELQDFAGTLIEGTKYPLTVESWTEADDIFDELRTYEMKRRKPKDTSTGSGLSTPSGLLTDFE